MWFRKKPPVGAKPEWMIVGLGNPGGEYAGTRHNVGFMVVDALAEAHRIKLDKSKHRARYGIGMIGETCVLLVKPLTYMNLSGQALAPMAREHDLKPDHILVVADELDLPVGRLKMQPKGGAGGHNGHKSIIASLGTQDYPRIRIGIGKGDRRETVDHVLGAFPPEERVTIQALIKRVDEACRILVTEGLERAITYANNEP